MMTPTYDIDPAAFNRDPYPDLAKMRADCPIVYVPQLDAVLITRRDDIFTYEKQIDLFSSVQPQGLMTQLMGQNMMRKDGEAHLHERRAVQPALSAKTVKAVWRTHLENATEAVLDDIEPQGKADLVADFAMPVAAKALIAVSGLSSMSWQEMDRVSQGMIDGCANYSGNVEVEAYCHQCTASIDHHIDLMLKQPNNIHPSSLLAVQLNAGVSLEQTKCNIRLAISGGQNETRDAIAGTAWSLLTHDDVRSAVQAGGLPWQAVFEEFARWISPIGMSPRRITRSAQVGGVSVKENERAFFMFSSGNRDERCFSNPERFDPYRDNSKSVSFGAGPHFCAGAWLSRTLISEVALPALFKRLTRLRLCGDVEVVGWAFRGPKAVPVRWD